MATGWLNRNVLLISFSAFFADLGYQTAIAIFPIFLVTVLKAPTYEFGIANAVAFGIGSLFGYMGGLMSDRFGDKRISILGNAFIPLLSLMGLAVSPAVAILLFSGGWWARNFRSPARRAMLVRSSSRADRSRSFGFLHMLDIGGGLLSIVILLALVSAMLSFKYILLLTIIPLAVSTSLLAFTKRSAKAKAAVQKGSGTPGARAAGASTYKGIIIATALYGFSYYSLGFPILTIAQRSGSLLGIGSYGVYLGVSAVVGYYIGSRKRINRIRALALVGYALSGLGTLLLGVGYLFGSGDIVLYAAVAVLGFALGVIETLEPTIISFIKGAGELGRGMGSLTASRSIGIFSANLIMGLLYVVSPFYSYSYAGVVSLAAGLIVFAYGRKFSG